MSAEFVGFFEPGSADWHEARKNGVGGSDVAAILGISKWESRFSLWHRLAGLVPPQVENEEMRAGKFLEPGICASFAERHGFQLEPAGTWRKGFQVANPDRFAYPVGLSEIAPKPDLLETKLSLYGDDFGEQMTDQIPPYYLTQCRWYLDVLDLDRCWVHVFVGAAGEFRTYIVERNDADQALMRERCLEFLGTVERGERPSIDEHAATYETVRRLQPDIDPIDVEIPSEIGIAFLNALRSEKHAESQARKARADVLDAVGSGRRAMLAGECIAIRTRKGEGTPYLQVARGLLNSGDDAA